MKQIAQLISDKQRGVILAGDLINNAVATGDNRNMRILMTIWKQCVEPTLEVTCNLCYLRVLNNFRELQPTLIELEKEYRCLD